MSRLHLIVLFIGLGFLSFSQNNLGKYLDFAKEQFNKGDYYYALEYYEKAMAIDSNAVDINWNYAETLRAYKDYRKAEKYYSIVYEKESAQIYPSSLLLLGLMQKQNGKYDLAIETFKLAKKKYYKDKKGYLYQKSRRELESTLWAQSAIKDTLNVTINPLPETVNTPNSEFGHLIANDELIFSSLRADSISASEEVYATSYHTHLYHSKLKDNSFEEAIQINELFTPDQHSGNGSYSLDGKRYYFSNCENDGYNYRCQIMVAQYNNGTWSYIDSLGEIINEPNTNTTMPCIADFNGQEVLIFASNREDSEGGLDLFYSPIKNGNQYGKVKAIKAVNSLDNEITPWWDTKNNRLYFSSSWFNGLGGHDVMYSDFNGQFSDPVNAGIPINSSANDNYFFKQEDTCFVSSNRIGVMYSKNPTCCSDIFSIKPPIIPPVITPEETLADLNKRLPVTLYFHNDIPDPDSWNKTTKVNYIDSYNDYTAMIGTYKKEYASGLNGVKSEEAKEDIESFFMEYVDKGVSDLKLFQSLLLKELENGAKIKLTVKGFASPLAKTEYNVNLTKRRISSLMNYLRNYDNGVFSKYMDKTAGNGGMLVFAEVPFGEYTANQLTSDNPNDVKNSVYSRSAAIERKIEIQSVSYFTEGVFPIITENPNFIFAETAKNKELKGAFIIKNESLNKINLISLNSDDDLSIKWEKSNLESGESIKLNFQFNSGNIEGHISKTIQLFIEGYQEPLQLFISTKVL